MGETTRQFTAEEAIRRKAQAQRVLSDPIVVEAFEEAERTFVEEWKRAIDASVREMAHAKVTALFEVQRVLHTIIDNGEYHEEIQKQQERQEEFKAARKRRGIRREGLR